MIEKEVREIFHRNSREVLAKYPKQLVEILVEVYQKGTELGIEVGRKLEREEVRMNPVSDVPLPEGNKPVLVSFVRNGERDYAFLSGGKGDEYISEGTANGYYADFVGIGDIDYWLPLPEINKEE